MEDIQISDFHQILFGDAPTEFLIEVLIRTVIIFVALLITVKWLGKRMAGQLTITELGIMIMLGAIVAPPMESPDRGILMGIMILFLILVYHNGLTLWGVKNDKVEKITQGELNILVKDGIFQVKKAKQTSVSHDQLFAVLRKKEIFNLGSVERVYMEACGLFSIYKAKTPKPGLSLLPPADDKIHLIQQKPEKGLMSCTNCGNTRHIKAEKQQCDKCGNTMWDDAVLDL